MGTFTVHRNKAGALEDLRFLLESALRARDSLPGKPGKVSRSPKTAAACARVEALSVAIAIVESIEEL